MSKAESQERGRRTSTHHRARLCPRRAFPRQVFTSPQDHLPGFAGKDQEAILELWICSAKKSDLETPEIICVLSAILRMIHFLAQTIPQEHVYPIIVKFWYTTFGHNTAFLLASKSKTAKQKIVLANALLKTTTTASKQQEH